MSFARRPTVKTALGLMHAVADLSEKGDKIGLHNTAADSVA